MSDERTQTQQAQEETVKKTGRGFLIITAAKVWFLITGAAIQLGLPIIFGSAELFGIFKIVTEAISLLNMVVIAGTLQAVSKLVSEQPQRANAVVMLALKLQCLIGLPLAALYALGSPWIAQSFNDPALAGLIRLSSLIILFYAFYAVFVGYLNGLKEFVKQATLDMTFATLKLIGIMGLVVVGFGVIGAVSGFVAAAAVICVVAGVWTFRLMSRRQDAPDDAASPRDAVKRLLGYLVLVMLYTFALNGIMRADLFVLKSIAADVPAHLAGAEPIFKVMSDKFAGFYGAVLNIARIPYQGVIAVTFVIFPLISEATFREDLDSTRGYIRTTFRYCILLIASVAMVLAFNSDSLIAGLYSSDYQAASAALAYLSVSIIFFALFYVATTMIIGSGHPLAAVVIMGISLGISAVLNYVLVSGVHADVMASLSWAPLSAAEAGPLAPDAVSLALDQARNHAELAGPYLIEATTYMESAAIATTIAMVFGCLLSIAWLYRTFGAYPPPATLLRLLVAAGVLFGFDVLFHTPTAWIAEHGKLVFLGIVLVKMAIMGILLLLVLALTREFRAEDLERLKTVIGRKKRKS